MAHGRFLLLLPLMLPAPALAQPAQPPHAAHPAPPRPSPARPAPSHPAPAHSAPVRPAHPARAPAHRSTTGHAPSRPQPAPAPTPVPVAPAAVEKPAEPARGTATNLPLPRFVSLRGEVVNFRAGPGRQYPIEWVYQRRDLPVEIQREFENWRLVADQDGVKGWVHQATLTSRRTAVVVNGEHDLRSDGRPDASVVAHLKPGVVIRLRACAAGAEWCQASTGDYRGWIRRADIWGLLPNEEIAP